MSILEVEDELFQIEEAFCDDDYLRIVLKGGLCLSTPLTWYERLSGASPEQRDNLRVLPFGDGIHWPDLDEDLSVKGILRYAASRGKRHNEFEVAE
ncbi:MAG: DUF2442 domain-containing protein [Rhodospirillales bacterium]|nr:DUF2442 domain-containing protein [Alphaproteobacteria bacterium]MCB9980843.1 DUF2442 domain-containing protein [Rhodospirillales bacterium]